MQEYRSRCCINELSEMSNDEDDITNLSDTRDPATTDATDDLRTAVINRPASSLGFKTSKCIRNKLWHYFR